MDILIVGSEGNARECLEKFGESHSYRRVRQDEMEKYSDQNSIVFDFEAKDVSVYTQKGMFVFVDSSKTTLAKLTSGKPISATFFGFCGLPTFLNREVLEVTILEEGSKEILNNVCRALNTKYKVVDDKAGMITPRIISMIINEAYFAIEEMVASKEDIDLAMKLGTNYPFGPFEWGEKIGLKNIYELLRAVHTDTKDDRYEICQLLEKEALA